MKKNLAYKKKRKEGQILAYAPLDTILVKLQKKKANLRCQWQRITDRVKSGSELAPVREAEWFARLNEIFTETKKEEDCNGTVMVN